MNINIVLSVRNLSVPVLSLAALFAQPAFAQTAGATMSASAEVIESCTVSSTPIAFVNVDVTTAAAVDGTGGISVVCTNGTAWAASAGAGTGAAATLDIRQMSDGAETLNYALYTDSARTTIWGDGTTGQTITDTGSGVAQDKDIYARILAGQTGVTAGNYADTVAVTVTY